VKANAEDTRYLARLQNPPPIPRIEWALLIGDCVHNLRSALDYIAWELAGADPTDRVTMFPIFLNPDAYRREAPRRIERLPSEAQTLIEELQPYHATDPPKSGLWALHTLDAADKHQLLTVTAVMPESGHIVFSIPPPGAEPPLHIRAFSGTPLEHDAILAEVVVEPATPKVDMKAEVAPDVAFGESLGWGRRMFVLDNLRRIIEDVEAIAVLFKQRFNMADHS